MSELFIRNGNVVEVQERDADHVRGENLNTGKHFDVTANTFDRTATPFPHLRDFLGDMNFADYNLLQFIRDLEKLNAPVIGIDSEIHSDRGDYSLAEVSQSFQPVESTSLAAALRRQLGASMNGWKGGTFPIDPHKALMVGEFGSIGKRVDGVIIRGDGVLRVHSVSEEF